MTSWSVLGIDPGKQGAVVAILQPSGTIFALELNSRPADIWDWLQAINEQHPIRLALIEDVHSIFGTGAKSNFQFGFNVGVITGILQSMRIPLQKIQPKEWQAAVGIPKNIEKAKRKKAHAEVAHNLYPKNIEMCYTPRGRLLDGVTDALLIAHVAQTKTRQ